MHEKMNLYVETWPYQLSSTDEGRMRLHCSEDFDNSHSIARAKAQKAT